MKTKIAAWLYIIFGALLVVLSGFVLLVGQLLGILGIALGSFNIILGFALNGLKKWAWYAGIVISIFNIIGGLVTIFTDFKPAILAGVVFAGFILYALISEKHLFFPPT